MDQPTPKTVYQVKMANFNGIDLRNSPSNVTLTRSPGCINMIRDTIGTNRKRFGYETVTTLSGSINGFHSLSTPSINKTLVHAGTNIYDFDTSAGTATLLYSAANNHLSVSEQVNSKLYILDGANLLVYNGTTITNASTNATIPVITFAKAPSGGGTSLNPINLITPWREERFTGDSTLVYQLDAVSIDADPVLVQSLKSDGTFEDLEEGTDFTVDRTLGTLTFTTAHATPVTGTDNIYVKYAKTVTGYANRIKQCDISTLYGMNGQRDRMFVSGNANFPNYDWYCASNDPTYWGDTWYSVLGQDDSAIVGYSIVNGELLTYKNGADNDSNIVIRSGTYDSNTSSIVFKSSGNYEAAGCLGKYTICSLKNEPIYLTAEKNIHAVTPSDYSGERSSQERSYYISTALAEEAETDLKNAYACVYDDFYMLAVGSKVYILDSAQISYEKNAPYSTRQYEAYLWTGINAKVLARINDRLYFGTSDGKVKRFKNAIGGGYTDDGVTTERTVDVDGQSVTTTESYSCYWETPEIYCGSTDHSELKKTFKHLVLLLNAYPHTGCRVWAKIDGIWEVIFDYDVSGNYFDWNDINFDEFTFRTDDTPTLVGGKFKAKKLLHIQFRFENSKPQPFSILFAKTKYTVGNEYRK